MVSLHDKVKSIVEETHKIINEKFQNENMELDYVAVFSKSNEEYDFYCSEADKIGKVLLEQDNGITFQVNPIITIDGEVSYLKIRKPDESKIVSGAADYKVEDYNSFKLNNSDLEIKTSADGVEIIEIADSNYDAMIYVPLRAFSEDYLNSRNESNEAPDFTNLLEQEKQKRIELMSDFQNYKKRVEQEKALFGAMANMGLIQEVLEVFDDLNLAMNDQDLNLDHAKSSIKSAQDKIISTIERAGVERVEVKVGDEFDKEKMEAISTIPVPDESQKGKVIAVISSAFKYRDRDGILKSAKVVVGK